MNRIVWLALMVSQIGFFSSASAQTADFQTDSIFFRKMADDVLSSATAYENLRVLCKTIGPRLAGSPGMYKSEAWAEQVLRAAGADKVWKQAVQVPHWDRGGKDEAWYQVTDANGKKTRIQLDILALGNSIGTGKNGLFKKAVLIEDFEELEKRKEEVKDAIVVFNNVFNPRNLSVGQSYGESGAYRRAGPSRAAKYGAAAILIRSVSASANDNHPHTGTTSYDSAYPKIPAAAMGLQDADKLIAALKAGKSIQVYYKSLAHFKPDATGHNIIGELTGSVFPDQYITVGGHLDSWDPAEGAHDDGTGCVQSIDIIRAMKAMGYKPRYTIRVVLFANEENGLRGGAQYAQEAKSKGEKHVFALESDAGGFTPRSFGFT
ncbi:M28 family peptidase, partial [Flavihumibacter sp. CACIAM 22H1]|uniref:M28 family peptidase n=1 Tax=Flavihumibacter sp. CACIAM 22H1 TaxID=1812911 RepID=UPI0007A8DE35